MKKLAVFVEGLTEQLFVDRLISEIAGRHTIAIEHRKMLGKAARPRWRILKASRLEPNQDYFILIVDCSADNRVKSEILDQYDSLVSNGYSAIVGIRDVCPEFPHAQIPQLRAGLQYKLRTKPVCVAFALGVMEIETWFISEHTHFSRLSPKLTTDYISGCVGFDPSKDDIQLRFHPAADLDSIYQLVNHRYTKKRAFLQNTTNLLDYAALYLSVSLRIPDLGILVQSIDAFLAPDPQD